MTDTISANAECSPTSGKNGAGRGCREAAEYKTQMSDAFLSSITKTESNDIIIHALSTTLTVSSSYSTFASFTGNFVSVFCFVSLHTTGNYYFSTAGALTAEMTESNMTMMLNGGEWRVLFLKQSENSIQIRCNAPSFQHVLTIIYYILTTYLSIYAETRIDAF